MKLHQLFTPTALAATIGSGMLIHSAVNALAGDCYSVPINLPGGGSGHPEDECHPSFPTDHLCCVQDSTNGKWFFWCCPETEDCSTYIYDLPTLHKPNLGDFGFCCP